ncbi:MAG: tRNA (cytidine(34)-2'-O)-methyltransferase [Planctomycetota bacterium]
MLHLVLYRPAIPQNTGTTARQCVGMGAHLHLVDPMFDLDEKAVRRAGLDYWPHLQLTVHTEAAFRDWLDQRPRDPYLVTKHGSDRYDRPAYRPDDTLILGNENTGLPDWLHDRYPRTRIALPMPGTTQSDGTLGTVRSYNLANAAAIVLTHAWSVTHPVA